MNVRPSSGFFPFLVTQTRFHVFGIRRSGHHAVMYWMFGHLESKNFWHSNDNFFPFTKIHEPTLYKADKKSREYDYGFLSFEDAPASLMDVTKIDYLYKPEIEKIAGPSTRVQNIIVLRDPFNMFASRYKYWLDSKRKLRPKDHERYNGYLIKPERFGLWKTLAKVCLDMVRLEHPVMFINYNRWVQSEEYRRELSKRFGWEFTDRMRDFVPREGGGSSFDGRFYAGRGSQMNVMDRWAAYKDDDFFKSLFDDEIKNLSKSMFDFCPF